MVNNLYTALALAGDVAHPNVGVVLDTFHFYAGPSKLEDLHALDAPDPARLSFVHVNDVPFDTPRDCGSDTARVLPGEGAFPLGASSAARRTGYDGAVSLELFNEAFAARWASEFGGRRPARPTPALAALPGRLRRRPLEPTAVAPPHRPLRLGYVGAGTLAQRVHLPNFSTLDGCRLVALAEVRPVLGEAVRRASGSSASTSTTRRWRPTRRSTPSPSPPPSPCRVRSPATASRPGSTCSWRSRWPSPSPRRTASWPPPVRAGPASWSAT